MALDLGCKTTEYYIGDGVQTDFTFSFQLLDDADLRVGIYNTTTNEYDETTDWSKPDSTSIVRFDTAPENGIKIIVYRLTEVDPLKAIFHPGHPVKAADLNDNFEQLQFAILDDRCAIERLQDAIDSLEDSLPITDVGTFRKTFYVVYGQTLFELPPAWDSSSSPKPFIFLNGTLLISSEYNFTQINGIWHLKLTLPALENDIIDFIYSLDSESGDGDGGVAGVSSIYPGNNISVSSTTGDVVISSSAISTVIGGNNIDVETNGTEVTINSTAETLVYSGVVDLTGEHTLRTTPPLKQDLFLNTGDGIISASWAAEITNASAGDPCFPGDFVVYNQTNYELISAGGPPTTDGLWVESAGRLFPATLGNKVGIGTNNALAKLDIANDTARIQAFRTSAPAHTYIADNSTFFHAGVHTSSNYYSVSKGNDPNDTDLLVVDSDGNVGIGRTNPQSPLEVGGNGYFSSRVDANKFRVHDVDGGSALSPSIMPGYDNDTGFFQPVTNNIGFSTFGVERMRIDDLGNVGINVEDPQEKLHVNGDILIRSATPNLKLQSPNSSNPYYVAANVSDAVDGGIAIGRGTDLNSGTDLLTIKANGNVGFGVSDPQASLDVQANTAQLSLNSTTDKYSRISHKLSGVTAWSVGTRDNTDYYIFRETAANGGNIVIPSGYVGIGTTNPVKHLHLKGSSGTFIRVESTNTGSGSDVAGIEIKTNLSRAGGVKSLDENDNELWFIGRHYKGGGTATRLDFDVAGSTAMSIPVNGNVGIGTTNPQAKLDVNGTAFIGKGGEDSEILRLNTDRPWGFFQRGSGSNTILDLASGDNKSFSISSKKQGEENLSASVFIGGSNGNVGIGTTDPQAKLDVDGDIKAISFRIDLLTTLP